MSEINYVELVDEARVYDVAIESPLEVAHKLSDRLGNRVLMKREDLQPVHSFKLRGAYNRIAAMSDDELLRGVICSSAGNHAQGVALAAQRRGVPATVVMPLTTPEIKIDAVRALGGSIVLRGDSYDDAYAHARSLAAENGYRFIHPFDDPLVIAGQGTIAAELLKQADAPIDAVVVPIGGGGLAAGIAAYLKQRGTSIRILGVEPEDSAGMQASIAAGHPVTLDHVGIFADGVAVRRVGDEPFALLNEYIDEIVTVDTDETCAAIRDAFEDTRSILEPAGALAIAATKKIVAERGWTGKNIVAICCGANVNFDRLRHIAERAAVGEHEEMLLAAEIEEQPGSFRRFCDAVGRRGITEFNYRYSPGDSAHIFVGVKLVGGLDERAELLAKLTDDGYPVIDLSDNEMAKLHVRHLVGGRAANIANERLFRFEFPERPGALLEFLSAVGNQWNITLFHYRNHGSDYGRVLAGIDVPDNERDRLETHLSE
ncbi:MAG: threonine ammonia-lyase, biosynthetic, partial [Pseudomonadota bacterium]